MRDLERDKFWRGERSPVAQLRVGDRVLTFTMDEAGRFVVDVVEVDPATWKLLRLRLVHDDGFWVDVEMLRSPEWIAQHRSEDRRPRGPGETGRCGRDFHRN